MRNKREGEREKEKEKREDREKKERASLRNLYYRHMCLLWRFVFARILVTLDQVRFDSVRLGFFVLGGVVIG